jgi:hypothetical protein
VFLYAEGKDTAHENIQMMKSQLNCSHQFLILIMIVSIVKKEKKDCLSSIRNNEYRVKNGLKEQKCVRYVAIPAT